MERQASKRGEFQSLFSWNSPSDRASELILLDFSWVSILVFLELALGQRLFFVLFAVSHCQTALSTPSSEHYKNLLEGL